MHRGVSVQEKESSSSNEQGECEIIKEKKNESALKLLNMLSLFYRLFWTLPVRWLVRAPSVHLKIGDKLAGA